LRQFDLNVLTQKFRFLHAFSIDDHWQLFLYCNVRLHAFCVAALEQAKVVGDDVGLREGEEVGTLSVHSAPVHVHLFLYFLHPHLTLLSEVQENTVGAFVGRRVGGGLFTHSASRYMHLFLYLLQPHLIFESAPQEKSAHEFPVNRHFPL